MFDFLKNHLIQVYLVLANVSLFALMGLDKLKAKMNSWRISEKTLLILGLAGGGIGGLLGQRIFHHKTRKYYFTLCFLIGIGVALFLLFYLR
ncbi:DUF1294 domain-containing protein [Enterococcus asini]|uniref:DUF1294 domain-containing protein n=1 Tax=Enterococcus asini TaxID=57732 RepID=UPI00288FCD12|nr:DUF1294 domain-containing protein [Enterococcus asini]MDT2756933.1 DUF1294 domain-containing protein [Enterococcus asini]